MSGLIEDQNQKVTSIVELKKILENGYQNLLQIWESIYGPNSKHTEEKLMQSATSFKEFLSFQIENAEEKKKSVMKSVEQMGKEAVELEKALGLNNQIMNLEIEEVPLIEMEDALWKLLESYRSLKADRMADYSRLQKREEELCSILDEKPKFVNVYEDTMQTSNKGTHLQVPSNEDMECIKKRIEQLEAMEEKLKAEFEESKTLFRNLLQECDISPFNKAERAVCSDDENESNKLFPLSEKNLQILKKHIEEYTNTKNEMVAEANSLRDSISKLAKKMLKNQAGIDDFLIGHNGFSKLIIAKLKDKLSKLQEERKVKLKDLILQHRTLLNDLWAKCCYTDQQREEFRPYHLEYYSEDILDLHELEVERLEMFYNQNKRIFHLAEKHKELWTRLLQLEEQSSHTERLFNNRGGRLLLEEKERKTIQKKVPAIKAELVTLLNGYKATTGKDFLYCGSPLSEMLERMEENREATKENQKRMRKAANTENILLESRLGSRPVANKRKITTPHQQNVTNKIMKMAQTTANSTVSTASSKSTASSNRGQKLLQPPVGLMLRSPATTRVGVGAAAGSYAALHTPRTPVHMAMPRTPAASTPENGSPSYESFQEHLEKSTAQKGYHSSRRSPEPRVLRPRNLNETVTKTSTRITPYKTPKTPSKTPSKIPFRFATGGKIPSIVPPISPRITTKLTTPRSKLPIIF